VRVAAPLLAAAALAAACASTPIQESTAKLKSDLVEDNRVSATDFHIKT
jgi:hypothetical protein